MLLADCLHFLTGKKSDEDIAMVLVMPTKEAGFTEVKALAAVQIMVPLVCV